MLKYVIAAAVVGNKTHRINIERAHVNRITCVIDDVGGSTL